MPTGTNSAVNSDVTTVLSNNNISTGNLTTTILVNGAATDVSKAPSGAKISVRVSIPVATPEDLIVYKAFAGRPLDWADVESVIAKQPREKLDWRYIFAQLTPLAELKEDAQTVPKLKEIRRIVERGFDGR